jgi:hypothetical protein
MRDTHSNETTPTAADLEQADREEIGPEPRRRPKLDSVIEAAYILEAVRR